MKKITVMGGGTGTFVVLNGLKKYNHDLAVIVSMMDSGGSTGRLRDQLGVLPPGDLRQCLVALSEASLLWRRLFIYRFKGGDLEGHNFGNVFLSALEKVCKNYDEVIEKASYVLQTKGEVIPVIIKKTNLFARYKNGHTVKGEGRIEEYWEKSNPLDQIYLKPEVEANPKAIRRIKESNVIILGPGDLYTSILPIFLVKGIKEAFLQSKAKVFFYNESYDLKKRTNFGIYCI